MHLTPTRNIDTAITVVTVHICMLHALLTHTQGMILLSELSRRRIRSINKLIRVGRNECVVVLRVDKEKVMNALYNFVLIGAHWNHNQTM